MGEVLLEDTRQQRDKHEIKHEWWGSHDVGLIRSKLPFGDYCLVPPIAVDTKASIQELAYDIDQEHRRFHDELVGARDAGMQLVVLVENTDGVGSLEGLSRWAESPEDFAMRKHAQRRLHGARLAKACATMEARYGVRFEFCAPEESAARILEILHEVNTC